MSGRRNSLVFHSQHQRHVRGGCLPLYLLLSLALIIAVLLMLRVEMTPPLRPAGEGNILLRKDQLLESQIRQRSPLPLRLPRYIAPLRQDEGVVNLPFRRTLTAAPAPQESPFTTAPDSVVLNATVLLELPPENPVSEEAPDTEPDGKEAE